MNALRTASAPRRRATGLAERPGPGLGPPVQRCSFGGARPVLRHGLALASPPPTCLQRPSAAAAKQWTSNLVSSGFTTALRTAPSAPVVGSAVRAGRDPGPASHPGDANSARPPHSHGGGRGRGRYGGRGHEGARGRGMGQGHGRGRGRDGYGGGRGAGAPTPADRGRGRGRSPDLRRLEHLGQLQEVVEQWAEEWASTRKYEGFARAFNRTCRVWFFPVLPG